MGVLELSAYKPFEAMNGVFHVCDSLVLGSNTQYSVPVTKCNTGSEEREKNTTRKMHF
jgi:hypothetical protein